MRPVTDLIRALPVLIGVVFLRSGGGGDYWGLAVAGLAVVAGVVRWFTTWYRITDDRVYLRRGLFSQKVLSVARDRVRTVDLSGHLLHRLLGLRRVTIGTGRNDRRDRDGFRLDALTLADAEALQARLLASRAAGPAAQETATRAVAVSGVAGPAPAAAVTPAPAAQTVIVRLHPSWVRFAPFTLTGLVIVGVVFGFFSQVVFDSHVNLASLGPVRHLDTRFSALSLGSEVAAVAVVVLVGLVLISIAGYIAIFWNFRLVRDGSTLRVTRGLLSTRAVTIDLARLRGAELSEPLLLRAARGARCIAITTGLHVGRGAEDGGSMLLPPAPRVVARTVAAQVIGVAGDYFSGPLRRHGPQARRRRYLRALAGAVLVIAAVALAARIWAWPAWTWLASLVTLPLAAALAEDRYRSLGHRLDGGWLVTSCGSLVRRRSVLSVDGVVGWRVHQTWFQRRQGLVTLTAATAAGRQHYSARDIQAAEAIAVAHAAASDLVGQFLAVPRPAAGKDPDHLTPEPGA